MLTRTFIPFPILTTERLTLRQPEINDDKEIFILRSDSEINKFLDRQLSNGIEDARNFINMVNENVIKNDSLYWAITLKNKSSLIGTICLFGFSEDNEKCEIGYELLANFQGQGIMKEAAETVIEFAFHTIQVKKIEAFVHKDNLSSIKLLKRFSFRESNEPDKTDPYLVGYYLTSPY